MKAIFTTICALSIGIISADAQAVVSNIPSLPGWSSLPGDEFNGTSIDKKIWGLYGDADRNYANDAYGNNEGQGMAQTYRDQMVSVKDGIMTIRATRDAIKTGIRKPKYPDINEDYSVIPRYPLKPNHNFTTIGWWSGFLSSRDVKKYYPLYSRIEIKAKVPYDFGTWMGLWLRHRLGASTFEIDLLEFFVNDDNADIVNDWEGHTYKFKNKRTLHQSVHGLGWYQEKGTKAIKLKNGYNYNPFSERVREISFDPAADFHAYGVQIDPLPGDSSVHLAVSFLLDGRVRSVFSTKDYVINGTSIYKYNEVLKDKYLVDGDIEHVWDVAINGGIGGKPDGKGGGILYPHLDPKYGGNLNNVPHNYEMNVDWMRVYKRTNRPLWLGSKPVSWDWKTKDVELEIPAERFAGLKVGDQLVIDIDTLSASEYRVAGKSVLDIYDKSGESITTLKPELTRLDAQVTFVVNTDDLCNKLKTQGCVLKGENIRLFSVCRAFKESAKWVGFKQIQWGETLIPAEQFKDVTEGQQLEIMVRDVDDKAQVFLRQFRQPEQGERNRPALSTDKKYGHILNLTAGSDEKTYTLTLNAQAVQELKDHGLAVTGKGYYLRSVRVIGEKKGDTAVKMVETTSQKDSAVYTMDGLKVADRWQEGAFPRGVYVVGGRKIIVK